MKNKTLRCISIVAILVNLALVESYAQIDFRVKLDKQNLIRVDGKFSFNIEIENIGSSEVKVMYPIYEEQVFCFLKEEGGMWSEISIVRMLADGSYGFTLNPHHLIEKPYSLFPDIMLFPNKNYILKIVYYPKEIKGKYYNPNKEQRCPKSLCKEHNLVFVTDSLSKNGLEEWMWLESHNLRRIYSTNGYRSFETDTFEEVEKFIDQYPNSIFINGVKALYVEYVAYNADAIDISLEMIEKSFQFCRDIEKEDPRRVADYLLFLNKKKEQIKN